MANNPPPFALWLKRYYVSEPAATEAAPQIVRLYHGAMKKGMKIGLHGCAPHADQVERERDEAQRDLRAVIALAVDRVGCSDELPENERPTTVFGKRAFRAVYSVNLVRQAHKERADTAEARVTQLEGALAETIERCEKVCEEHANAYEQSRMDSYSLGNKKRAAIYMNQASTARVIAMAIGALLSKTETKAQD